MSTAPLLSGSRNSSYSRPARAEAWGRSHASGRDDPNANDPREWMFSLDKAERDVLDACEFYGMSQPPSHLRTKLALLGYDRHSLLGVTYRDLAPKYYDYVARDFIKEVIGVWVTDVQLQLATGALDRIWHQLIRATTFGYTVSPDSAEATTGDRLRSAASRHARPGTSFQTDYAILSTTPFNPDGLNHLFGELMPTWTPLERAQTLREIADVSNLFQLANYKKNQPINTPCTRDLVMRVSVALRRWVAIYKGVTAMERAVGLQADREANVQWHADALVELGIETFRQRNDRLPVLIPDHRKEAEAMVDSRGKPDVCSCSVQ